MFQIINNVVNLCFQQATWLCEEEQNAKNEEIVSNSEK